MLGEPVARRAWLAVALGFVGVLIVVRPGLRELNLGYVLVLLGAALWAVYQVLLRIVSRPDPPSTTALWTAVAGAAALTTVGPFFWTWPDATGWLMLAALAACGTLGHVLYSIAFRFAPARSCSPSAISTWSSPSSGAGWSSASFPTRGRSAAPR